MREIDYEYIITFLTYNLLLLCRLQFPCCIIFSSRVVFVTGRGIFASSDIPKSSFVVEYTGELLDAETAYQREVITGGVYLYYLQHNGKKLWLVLPIAFSLCSYVFQGSQLADVYCLLSRPLCNKSSSYKLGN